MEEIKISEDINVVLDIKEEKIFINWSGVVDTDETNKALSDFFQNLHNRCIENKHKSVVIFQIHNLFRT